MPSRLQQRTHRISVRHIQRRHSTRAPSASISATAISSSASVTCVAYCRAIFDIIMTPARISRSTRTAHGLVACNFPPRATLLPSPRSAVCIIAMSVGPREIGEAARFSLSPPNCPEFIFEQGHCDGSNITSTSPSRASEWRAGDPHLHLAPPSPVPDCRTKPKRLLCTLYPDDLECRPTPVVTTSAAI